MIVVTLLLVVDLAPILILLPLAHPVLTFAKGFEVRIVRALQWTRCVDPPFIVDGRGRVLLAGLDRITFRRNALAEQAVHFGNLAMRHANGVLHYAPVVRLLAVVVFKPLPAGRFRRKKMG